MTSMTWRLLLYCHQQVKSFTNAVRNLDIYYIYWNKLELYIELNVRDTKLAIDALLSPAFKRRRQL